MMNRRRRVTTKKSKNTLSAGRNPDFTDRSKISKTFTLVIFSGGSYGVYPSSNISTHEEECTVRCSGGRFEAKILACSHDKDHLQKIKQKLDAHPFDENDDNEICSKMHFKNLLDFVSNCLAAEATKQDSNPDSFQDSLSEIDVNHNICEQETAVNISSKNNEAALPKLQISLISHYISDRSEIQSHEGNYSNPNSIHNISENQNECTTQPESQTTLITEPFLSPETQPDALAHDSTSQLIISKSEALILKEYTNYSVETASNEIIYSADDVESQINEDSEYNSEKNMIKNTRDELNDPINGMLTEIMEHVEETTVSNEIIYSADDVESQSNEDSEYNPEKNMIKNTRDELNDHINGMLTEIMEHVEETTVSNEIIYSADDVESQSNEDSEYNPEKNMIKNTRNELNDHINGMLTEIVEHVEETTVSNEIIYSADDVESQSNEDSEYNPEKNMIKNTRDELNDPINGMLTEIMEHVEETTVSNEIIYSADDVESQSNEDSEYNPEKNMIKNTRDELNDPINGMLTEGMEHVEETIVSNEFIYSDDDVEFQSNFKEGSEYNREKYMNKNTRDDSNDPINSMSTDQMENVRETNFFNEIIYSDDDVESQSDEGSEYNPENHCDERDSSYVADSDDDLDEPEACAPNKSTSMNGSRNQSTDRSCNLSSTSNVLGTSACDDTGMIVKPSTGPKGAGKLYFCYFCHKKISKIARHLESVHKDEAEVKKFAILPKKTAERAQMIKKLRDKGNFIHNKNADFNQGELIPCRRPQKKMNKNAQHFVPCPKCKGFYAKNNIRHHYKLCAGGSGTNSRSILVAARKMLGRVDAVASLKLRTQIIPVMREDEIVRLIRYDHLLTLYGNKMCRKFKKAHQDNMIRAHLRLLGRFLMDLKKNNPEINDFASLYDAKFYDAVLLSINNIAEFDEETEVYGKPSLASSIGTCLKKIGAILETECIKHHDDEKKSNTADFLKLFNEDFGCSVGKTVTESQIKYRRQKTVDLPETDDISRLNNFLNEKREAAYQSLQEKFTYEAWLSLAQATLILIQVFNRRRAGEIERVTIDDFNCRKGADEIDKHSLSSLPIKEQEAARKYVRLTICGKLNRTVPVLLSTEILQSVLTIVQFRGAAKVPHNNPYVFGLPNTTNHKRHVYLRACNLMRKFAEECSATNPKALRGTTLRKHVATKCASMNLPENEICDVANFMGHHENIHKNIYRQPVINRDIIRMSQVLEQAVGTSNAEPKTKDCGRRNVLDEMNSETAHHNAPDDAEEIDDSLERQNQLLASINNQKKKHIQSKNKYRNYGAKKNMTDELSADMQDLSSRDSLQNYFNAIDSQISDTEDDDQAKSKCKLKRRRWSQDEVKTCLALFETDITESIIPSLPVIAKKIANHSCLTSRTPVLVKAWINNQIKKREKSEARGENKKHTSKNYR